MGQVQVLIDSFNNKTYIYKYYFLIIIKMDFNKDLIKNCPKCNSVNISGTVSTKNGRYIQKINCKECSYKNNRDIGSSEEEIVECTIDEEEL